MKHGDFLTQLNGKTIDKIYKVDFNNDNENDNYLPWLFFFTFNGFDKFLEIEGDFDGDHIKISLTDLSELKEKLQKSDFPNVPDLWKAFTVKENEPLGKIIDKTISKCGYGIDKDEIEIKGQKNRFTFVRFYFDNFYLTIFERGSGLYVTDDPNVKLNFKETFDKYDTEQ